MGRSARALEGAARKRLPAVTNDPRRVEAGNHARGHFRRIPCAAGAQAAADRHWVRPGLRLPRDTRRRIHVRQGPGRSRRARCRRLCILPSPGATTGAARAQSRGAPHPVADCGDHDHRLSVRRLPFRARGRRAIPRSRTKRAMPSSARASPAASPASTNPHSTSVISSRTGCRWLRCSHFWSCFRLASISTSSPRFRRCFSASVRRPTAFRRWISTR